MTREENEISGVSSITFTASHLSDLLHLFLTTCISGVEVRAPGEPCGNGLSSEAAKELGLNVGTSVGMAIIDAHAGGIGKNKERVMLHFELHPILFCVLST